MEWGWNPDTVGAVTTALAAVAAVVAGIFAGGAYRAERQAHQLAVQSREAEQERDAATAEEKRRAQADLVAVWTEVVDSPDARTLRIVAQNASATPVFALRIGVVLGAKPVYARWVRLLPPGGAPQHYDLKEYAHEQWRRWAAGRGTVPEAYVEYTFRDAGGRHWLRDSQGALTEIDEDQAWRYGPPSPERETVPPEPAAGTVADPA